MLKAMPFKTDHLSQLHLPDRTQRTPLSGAWSLLSQTWETAGKTLPNISNDTAAPHWQKQRNQENTENIFFHFALWLGSRGSHTSMKRSTVFSQECPFQWQESVGNKSHSLCFKQLKVKEVKGQMPQGTETPSSLGTSGCSVGFRTPCSWTGCYGRWAGRGGSTPSAGWDGATGKQQCSRQAKAAQFERKLHGVFSNSLKCRKNSVHLNQQKNCTNLWYIRVPLHLLFWDHITPFTQTKDIKPK